jgi:hypothetical protein
MKKVCILLVLITNTEQRRLINRKKCDTVPSMKGTSV